MNITLSERTYSAMVLFTIFAMLFAVTPLLVPTAANAGGVEMFADLDAESDAADLVVATNAAISTPAELPASSTDEVFFSYTTEATYSAADTITLTVPAGYVVAVCDGVVVDDLDDDALDTADGTYSVSTPVLTFTVGGANTQTSGDEIELCAKITAPASDTPMDSVILGGTAGDAGAALLYVDDDNDVAVSASVGPTLQLAIRLTDDTGDTNACALGVLDVASVSTCDYRVKLSLTNATNGYTVYIHSDGDLRLSGSGDVADLLDVDPITEDSTVTLGTEDYGIALTGGDCTGGAITEQGDWTDDDTPIPLTYAAREAMVACSGPNAPASTDTTNTSLVTHRAAIDAATQFGAYTQVVTYTATASF